MNELLINDNKGARELLVLDFSEQTTFIKYTRILIVVVVIVEDTLCLDRQGICCGWRTKNVITIEEHVPWISCHWTIIEQSDEGTIVAHGAGVKETEEVGLNFLRLEQNVSPLGPIAERLNHHFIAIGELHQGFDRHCDVIVVVTESPAEVHIEVVTEGVVPVVGLDSQVLVDKDYIPEYKREELV